MTVWDLAAAHPWKFFVAVIVLGHFAAKFAYAVSFAVMASLAGGAL